MRLMPDDVVRLSLNKSHFSSKLDVFLFYTSWAAHLPQKIDVVFILVLHFKVDLPEVTKAGESSQPCMKFVDYSNSRAFLWSIEHPYLTLALHSLNK